MKKDCKYFYDMCPKGDYSEQWCTRTYDNTKSDGREPLHCENCKYYEKNENMD